MRLIRILATAAVLGIGMAASVATAQARNVVEVASSAGQFKTLLTAAKAAGLVPALSGRGPITVFAPTDAAFARLPAGTVKSLLEPRNRHKLATILKYHVVKGRVRAADIPTGRSRVSTLAGKRVSIAKHGGVRVNNARVTTADVGASNGVIHIIDRVLLPH
jgi:uncharacterized surface protein with fasciclin (FAS1) repeats